MRYSFSQVIFLVSSLLLVLAAPTSAQIITTVAGNGEEGFSGDGGPASSAELDYPTGVAVDGAGNIYMSDQLNQRIRMVDTSGIITTVAGNGTAGFGGDGDPAMSASLANPLGVTVDSEGNLFIADQHNHRIRMVDTSGTITTVAGNGEAGFIGDGGLATGARLNFPSAVLVNDDGDLFIADRNNHRIRKVDASSGFIITVAGDGSPGFGGDGAMAVNASLAFPTGLALDAAGNLFIADQVNERIRKVDATGIITTVAGDGSHGFGGDGGPATSASFAFPIDVAVDGTGNLIIVDIYNNRIRRVDTSGIITTVAGNGTGGFSGDGGAATSASLYFPRAVASGVAGSFFIADLYNHRIRKVEPTVQQRIEKLIQDVQALGLPGNGGQAQLKAALKSLAKDPPNVQAAINSLLSFINFVNAQSGKKIPTQDADQLIDDALVIIDLLQGS